MVYQFDGEYAVGSENNRENLSERVGAYTDNPHPIEAHKEQSSMKGAVGGFFATMAGIPVRRSAAGTYRQAVLVVANRRFNGQDARVSALIKEESGMLEPDMLIKSALQELMNTVGVSEAKTTEAHFIDSVEKKKSI